MSHPNERWIIEVDGGQIGWGTTPQRTQRRGRWVSFGLALALVLVGSLGTLGYVAYRFVAGLLLSLAAAGGAFLAGLAALQGQLLAILVVLGRWAVIAAVGGVRPVDVHNALEAGRWLYDAWRGGA